MANPPIIKIDPSEISRLGCLPHDLAVHITDAHFPDARDIAEGNAAYRRLLEILFFTDRRHKY